MELRRCSHVCRKDQIKKHLEAKRHVFNVEQAADPNFPKILTDNYKIRTLERLRQLVLEHTAQAVIKLGISLNKASQQDLWTFCAEMIRIGQSFAAERMDVNEAMVSFSRTILTEKVLEIGRRLKMRDMESAHEARFVNIAVDAGTVLGKSVVHAILTNPYSDRFPILLEISDNDGFDKFKYKQLFGILTMQCKKEQLTVCSIITDGLPAQKGALEELISDSEDEYVRSIVPIHCLAHVTQLVFVDIVKQSPYLKCVIGEIQELVRELRKPRIVRELGEKCPDLCQTRWLYIVDVLIWIYAREDKLNVFLLASDNNETQWKQLPLEWRQVMTILLPLKRLSLSMESSECALWEVIPIVESTMAAWRKVFHLLSDDGLELLKLAVTNLIRRFSRVVPSAISASFALSELGREVLRRREEGFQTRGTGHRCYTTERIMAAEALFDDVENDISTTSLAALISTTQGEKDQRRMLRVLCLMMRNYMSMMVCFPILKAMRVIPEPEKSLCSLTLIAYWRGTSSVSTTLQLQTRL